MNSPLYKKFQQLNSTLSEGDFHSAEVLLHDLHNENLPIAALTLFNALKHKFILTSGAKKIEFDSPVALTESKSERPDGLLSAYDNRALLDGISIVSCCMNRNDNLRTSLISWLKLPVQEIVIVDWSSDEPVSSTISDIQDQRIKVIRVENEPKWILTYGFNVGLRFASYSKIYKLDADIQVAPDFIEQNFFGENEFIRGNWKSAIESKRDDQKYVNGSFGASKKDLLSIGFYNEFIKTYGWDDSDLYCRLASEQGLKRRYLAFNSLVHLSQEEEDRLKHQDVSKNVFLNRFPATELTNSCNKYAVALFDKWKKCHLQDYSISCLNEHLWSCQRITKHQITPDFIHRDAEQYAVREMISWVSPVWAQKVYDEPWMAGFIFEQYVRKIPFDETASILLFENTIDIYFCKDTNPYRVIKEIEKDLSNKKSPVTQPLYIFEGNNVRVEVDFNNIQITLHGLEQEFFNSVEKLHETNNCLKTFPHNSMSLKSAELNNQPKLKRTLAISLYDENNKDRASEFLECIYRNLPHFDVIAIFYEKSNGSIYELANDLIATQRSKSKAEIIWIHDTCRPTFEIIFDAVDFIFPGTVATVTNADIAFDETINKVSEAITENSFFVLSRNEVVPETGASDGMLMNYFGLPNTLSADAWIYLTPRKKKFRADFPIGTFHCDSFLNYHIHKSGYELYNPCLSVNAFHIHDPRFNSSETKKSVYAKQINDVLIQETALCGGENPIRGVQWCRIEDTSKPDCAGYLAEWSNSVINIEIDQEGKNFFSSLVIAIMCLKVADHIDGNSNISLNIPKELASSELGNLLFDTIYAIGNESLNVAVTNSVTDKPFSEELPDYFAVAPDVESLINTYLTCHAEGSDNSLFGTKFKLEHIGDQVVVNDDPYILVSFDKNQSNDLTTYLLIKCLKEKERDLLLQTISSLNQKYPALQPIADEFRVATGNPNPAYQDISITELRHPVTIEKPTKFDISFITSIFRGEEYFKGFLENITASALQCNGEVILVDATSPENESKIFDDFIGEFPGLQNRFTYISLEKDPGLYNCWKLAIEESSSDLVSNANVDDRRSPWQSAVLIKTIKKNPGIGGAATAIRATTSKNTAWYSLTENQLWFTKEKSNSIQFKSLYLTDENGDVLSKNMMHCMPVWKRSLHQKYGYFDEERYGTSADWAFWLECTKNGETFSLIPSTLSLYFINQDSHNRTKDLEGEKELNIIRNYIKTDQKTFIQQ